MQEKPNPWPNHHNHANRIAILCNHRRAAPKTHDRGQPMAKMKEKASSSPPMSPNRPRSNRTTTTTTTNGDVPTTTKTCCLRSYLHVPQAFYQPHTSLHPATCHIEAEGCNSSGHSRLRGHHTLRRRARASSRHSRAAVGR